MRRRLLVMMQKAITSKAIITDSVVSITKLYLLAEKNMPTAGRFGRKRKWMR